MIKIQHVFGMITSHLEKLKEQTITQDDHNSFSNEHFLSAQRKFLSILGPQRPFKLEDSCHAKLGLRVAPFVKDERVYAMVAKSLLSYIHPFRISGT